jgi:hypothetical protein
LTLFDLALLLMAMAALVRLLIAGLLAVEGG